MAAWLSLTTRSPGKGVGKRRPRVDGIDFHGGNTPTVTDFRDGFIEQLIHQIRKI